MRQQSRPRLPAEWEPQAGVMLTWPHAGTDWGERLSGVFAVFTEIGLAVAQRESLLSVCCSTAHAADVRSRLLAAGAPAGRLRFCVAPSNDSWARDHGPLTTLADDRATLHDFVFNGWGGKFAARLDSAIARRLYEQQVFPANDMREHDFVLEGGALETDGERTLLATRSSIIDTDRNPGCNQSTVERQLRDSLGLERFLWLAHGDIAGDDTDGHIDTLARFADPQTILYTSAPVGDRDHGGLAAMERELQGLRTGSGQRYRLLRLPFAGVHQDAAGRRLPATYANFLIVNDAVLLPTYGVAQDMEAIAIVQGAFPGRQVLPIDCREIIRQNGSLHCLTMQFPAQLVLRDSLEFDAVC
jgi:agmatine/peptidylarginine deiminase